MARKKLPIGIQTFAEIRQENYYYVDKTPFALRLIDEGSHYFLSRPRRFGKSLLLDTLKELFEGHRELFTGLYAEQHWDWNVRYPVLHLSFGSGVLHSPQDLADALEQQLDDHEQRTGLSSHYPDARRRFQDLIQQGHAQTGQRVVVLIDEYDKPILDNLSQPEQALEMRETLRNFYSVLKDSDAHLKFVLLTGVSKFSKVSLFSGLNNLIDITIEPAYSAICGYTDTDVDTVFAPELEGLDRAQIRDWYNGYNWTGEAVYNPFDVLLLFRKRHFTSYWFETGTPTFLVDVLAERQWFTPDLSRLQSDEDLLSSFDVGSIAPEALLWQTGYLTFQKVYQSPSGQLIYQLGYPNREVEAALNKALLPAWGPSQQAAFSTRSRLDQALYDHDLNAVRASLHALFASIPHDWYRKNKLAEYEGHYASASDVGVNRRLTYEDSIIAVFYSQLAALGLNVQPEDITNAPVVGDARSLTNGDSTRYRQIDLSLRHGTHVYLFEFKVVDEAAEGLALKQLIERGYAEKYRAPGVSITLIGIEFSRTARNLVGFESAEDGAET